MSKNVLKRYLDSTYLKENPSWDSEDAPWKSDQIVKLLSDNNIFPKSICDVGCGSGDVLSHLKKKYIDSDCYGYDISPNLSKFWQKHKDIHFQNTDLLQSSSDKFDLVLVLDVLEHVANPFQFLELLHDKGDYYVFHIPLDLSAISVAREKPLLYVRHKVGHIHYYTKNIALNMLVESGYKIINYRYTNAYKSVSNKNILSVSALLPRVIIDFINKDLSARLLGGQTLMVLAQKQG